VCRYRIDTGRLVGCKDDAQLVGGQYNGQFLQPQYFVLDKDAAVEAAS